MTAGSKQNLSSRPKPILLERNQIRTIANTSIIVHCVKGEKARTQVYPIQMTDIPDRPFDKIVIGLVSDLNVSASGNQNISLHGMARGISQPITRKQTPSFIF